MIETPPSFQKRSWFLIIAVSAFAVVSLFSIFFEFQKIQLEKLSRDLQAKKMTLGAPLSGTSTAPNDSLSTAIAVKTHLQNIETGQRVWSKILEKIENTVPKHKDTKEPLVTFQSYNGTSDGSITVNAITKNISADPFEDVAAVARAFSGEPLFKHVFVPSITKSIGSGGNISLVFSLSFSFNNEKF